jgi:ribosomal protein S12 methylthiotransferase accessory factor
MMTRAAADTAEAFEELVALRLAGWAQSGDPPLTRARLQPVLDRLGITRVGDLTGLDQLGLPVWFATRPASRSLCVTNGKGLTDDAAWLSAVMEGAEQALAENAPALVALVASRADLDRRGLRSVALEKQARCAAAHLSLETEIAWVKGISWKTGETVYAPYELVGMDMAASAPWNVQQFRMSSLGLAAGRCLTDAIRHALQELIEDDAMFAPLVGGGGDRRQSDVRFDPSRSRDLQTVIGQLADRGMEARFANLTDGVQVPVVLAALKPVRGEDADRAYFCGSACREQLGAAALAALLEAVQSRLTFISGARDDLYVDEYGHRLKPGTEELFGGYKLDATGDEPARPPLALEDLASAVFDDGAGDISVFALGGRRFGFRVVRVLADELLSCQPLTDYPLGGRAGLKLLRRWTRS